MPEIKRRMRVLFDGGYAYGEWYMIYRRELERRMKKKERNRQRYLRSQRRRRREARLRAKS